MRKEINYENQKPNPNQTTSLKSNDDYYFILVSNLCLDSSSNFKHY
ncbi:Hypothetical Protein SLY_1097 [Strawberry lethal yellows phytoplasma (CPA) str. NZSb11]|uniref:Uncharacterized protein n=1 Tax=Strawberry lethal yellows phytoplasma (CPA) str. NZSb11 TaxID=980422 RepID=R4S2I6_PHYAS|nr:Hypothetical Protein SLY_1097 [Strawberry lethal yellows phytoplasma (CPA) str. NZSb11]